MLMLQVIINTVHVIIIVQCIVLMLTSQIIDENTSIFKHNHTIETSETETSETGYVQCMVNATVHKTQCNYLLQV